MKVIKRGSIDLLQQKITSWQRHCVTSGDVGSNKTEDWYPPPLAPLSHTPPWHIGENSWLHLVSFLSVHFVYIPTSPFQTSGFVFVPESADLTYHPSFCPLLSTVTKDLLNSKSHWQIQKMEKVHRTSTFNRNSGERNEGIRIVSPEKMTNFGT